MVIIAENTNRKQEFTGRTNKMSLSHRQTLLANSGNAYGFVVNSAMKRLRAFSAALYPVACLPNFSSNKMRSRKASSASSWGSKAVEV
ncbi:hypothetical protein [Nostoc parmelioides]|uniref:Uncharacterized protein n=1 Tax=Nostoc parmelioides FACHB-3921 TaxID=2692909 RepID=A0ABR8BQ84_9NOSO|nr:hypothetical protein [Nostoc parmelioides]MBD2255479.1 hypothetical protein [Nostoc parmelioides FACHB-3921]